MFESVFSDPPLLPQCPIHLWMLSLVCIAREFFFSRKSKCV
ncbi:unnamed protein product [Staurois parvus]|uniref:Uncharacterized protein n=1 Tax=Staurois parvus TaxID=386267 RepID=A0ABN9E1N5_9NEOB|nr:unnamed protein product [Staurois parvus]